MKKIVLALGCVAMFGLASCNKEKTCTCTYEFMGQSVTSEEFVIEDGDCEDGLEGAENFEGITCEEV